MVSFGSLQLYVELEAARRNQANVKLTLDNRHVLRNQEQLSSASSNPSSGIQIFEEQKMYENAKTNYNSKVFER